MLLHGNLNLIGVYINSVIALWHAQFSLNRRTPVVARIMMTFSTLLPFVRGIHELNMDCPHKEPVMRFINIFGVRMPEETVGQTVELPLIEDAMMIRRRHCNAMFSLHLSFREFNRAYALISVNQKFWCSAVLSLYDQRNFMMTPSYGNILLALALYAVNSSVTGEFPSQRPMTRSFDVFFDLCLNKRLSKHSWGWWFWDAIALIMTPL